jgi:hypothetical protein
MSVAERHDSGEAAPRFRPAIGRAIPASVVRLVVVLVILALSFGIVGIQPLLAVALLLSLVTMVFPRAPGAWLLAGFLALFSLSPVGASPGWKFFVALAGVHLLHVIGTTLTWLPLGGPVQLRILGRILRRFLLIQVPAQVVAYLVLNILAGSSGHAALISPFFGLAAVLALAGLAILISSSRV